MKKIAFILILIFLCWSSIIIGYASEQGGMKNENELDELEKQMQTYDFSEVDSFLQENTEKHINFMDVWKMLLKNDTEEQSKQVFIYLKKHVCSEIWIQKNMFIKITVIAIISAIFSTFAFSFKNQQLNQTAFFVTYLFLAVSLMQTYRIMEGIAHDLFEKICEFMMAFLPAFSIALGVSSGSNTAIGIYGIVIYAISCIEFAILKIILPLIAFYVVLSILNCMTKEDLFSRAVQLLETVIRWANKTVFATIIGLNIIKNMMLPSIDYMRNSMAQKILSVIPGVGDGLDGVSGIMLGTSRIIKNTMGTAALFILILLCFIPILKIMISTFLYQCLAAILQPITDKRIQTAIHCIFSSGKLLLESMIMVVLLFIIAIAIACVATNLT